MKNSDSGIFLQEVLDLYRDRKPAIQSRITEFAAIAEADYFYELVYCLLTPQSSAVHADRVVISLRKARFAERGSDPEAVLREPAQYIRFHKTKARHLLKARIEFPGVLFALTNGHSPIELREWLVRKVMGFGMKEATHFLRNIGKNGGLAILDRHILRNLKRLGVIRTIPDSLSKKQYLAIEKKFKTFAESIGIPLDELDLLFWSMETGEIRK